MAIIELAIFLLLSSSCTFLFRHKRLHTKTIGDAKQYFTDNRRSQKRDIFDNEHFLKFLSSQNKKRSYKYHTVKANTSSISSNHPVIEAILQRYILVPFC